MKSPKISIIAVIGKNRELGKNNKLLWHIPEDLKYFKKVTLGHPVIMGQNTFESIGRILPKRLNVILTKDKNFKIKGAKISNSIEDAIKLAAKGDKKEIFFIGGASIFSQMINRADKLYLTVVNKTTSADVYFPKYENFSMVKKVGEGKYKSLKYEFLELTKDAKT